MTTTDMRVTDGPDTVIRLPRGLAGYVGLFGLLWAVAAAVYHFAAIPQFPAPFARQADFVGTGFFAAAALLFVWLGLLRDEVRVGGGRLTWCQCVGPFRRRVGSVACAAVRRFVVVQANEETGGNWPGYIRVWSVLFAEDAAGRRHRVALWYRRELLLRVAAQIAGRCGLPGEPATVADDPDDRNYPTQPAASRLVLTRRDDGISILVPPLGRRCLDRYFWGSLLIVGLVGAWVAIGVGTLAGKVPWEPEPPPFWLVAGGFVGCGSVVVLVVFANAVLRLATAFGPTEVRVGPDGLTVVERGFLGTVRHEWTRERVADVQVEYIPKYNSKGVIVVEPDGHRTSVLDHCPVDDIKWVAARLREALGKSPSSLPGDQLQAQ